MCKYFLIGLTCWCFRPQTYIYAHCVYKTANELKRQLISIFHTAADHRLVSLSLPFLSLSLSASRMQYFHLICMSLLLLHKHTHKLSLLLRPSVNLIFPQLRHVSPLTLFLPLQHSFSSSLPLCLHTAMSDILCIPAKPQRRPIKYAGLPQFKNHNVNRIIRPCFPKGRGAYVDRGDQQLWFHRDMNYAYCANNI